MLKASYRQAESKLKACEEPEIRVCREGTQAPSMPKGKLKAKETVTQGTAGRGTESAHPTIPLHKRNRNPQSKP